MWFQTTHVHFVPKIFRLMSVYFSKFSSQSVRNLEHYFRFGSEMESNRLVTP